VIKKAHVLIMSLLIILIGTTTLAQSTCGELVTRALEKTSANCNNPLPNTVCYGNGLIFAQAQTGTNLIFAGDGDIAPIDAFAGITHSPLDESLQIWGVSLMSLQADVPDTAPGQVVQIIVFGNVEVNDVQQSAFRFTTGVGTSQCVEAPASGIMVRTPEGVAEVTLNINEVDITMGSTAYIEANASEGMTVTMLDGTARTTAMGVTQPVSFSQQLNIPMQQVGRNVIPSAPPSLAQAWDAGKISKAFAVYNTLNKIGSNSPTVQTAIPATPVQFATQLPPTIPVPTFTPTPCTIFATSASVITRVGPGTNRGSFIFLTPNSVITVTGKKIVGEDLWWQLEKDEVSANASRAVLELWVAEKDVTEQGDCNTVIDVDAPPIIRIPPTAAPQPTVDNTIRITPTSLGIVPAVEPYIEIFVEESPIMMGECTIVYVDIEFISGAFFSGPGFVSDTTVEGPSWDADICPPNSPGTYTYTLDAYSLSGNLVQRFVSVQVN
jgi:hypothetical protein